MPRQSSRLCDRCYGIKERCSWVEGSSQCLRCSRLGFTCSNTRQPKKPGRRALSAAALQTNGPDTNRSTSLLPRAFPSTGQLNLIHSWMSNYETFDRFLLGPAFWPRHRAALMTHLEHSQPILEHAFLASVLSATHSEGSSRHTSQPADGLSTVYQHAASALRRLRELHVTDRQQASTCLVLGTNIMLFAMFQRPENVFTLCRQTLVLVRPVYDTIDGPDPEDFFLTGTMMLDMLGSLIYGAVPALRFRPPKDSVYVDRYLGLSTSLLQLLYRVGELNAALSAASAADLAVDPRSTLDLDEMESTVLAWQPDVPEKLCSAFSAVEIAHIFCQVQVLRLCALLMIYRLEDPFGIHDAPARAIAISILTQFQTTLAVTGKAIKFAMLPVLVACVELTTQEERDLWLVRIPELVCCSKAYGLYIQGAVRAFWTARDAGVVFRGYNISQFISCTDDGAELRPTAA